MTDGSRPVQAAVWMLGAIVSFSSMAVAGRAVAGVLDTFELMMYRSFIGVVIILIVGGITGKLSLEVSQFIWIKNCCLILFFIYQ